MWIPIFLLLHLSWSQTGIPSHPVTELPYVWAVFPREAILADIHAREVKNLSQPDWCVFDDEMRDWCGPNSKGSVYLYCIFPLEPIWPQTDPNWIENATLAPTQLVYPGQPAFCACNNSGRAYWLVEGVGAPHFAYQPPCRGEHTLLALYILLMVLFSLCGIWAFLEVVLWVVLFWSGQKEFSFASAFIPKITSTIFCIMALIALVLATTNRGGFSLLFVQTWFWILCFIFLVLTFIWWLAIFTDVAQRIRALSSKSTRAASFCLYCIFPFVVVILCSLFATLAVVSHNGNLFTSAESYLDKQYYAEQTELWSKINIILGCIVSFIVGVWATCLVLKSGYDILQVEKSGGDLGEYYAFYKKKAWYNLLATIMYWPVFVVMPVFLSLALYNVYQYSEYQISIIFASILLPQGFLGVGIIVCLLLALQTQLTQGNYISQISHVITSTRSSSGGKSTGGGKSAGGKSAP